MLVVAQMSMEREDLAAQLLRMSTKVDALRQELTSAESAHQSRIEAVEQERRQLEERTNMQLEDWYRHLFNFEHRNQVQEFTIMELRAASGRASKVGEGEMR